MPDVELWQAVSQGCVNVAELADYFDVEPWFVKAKLAFLQRKKIIGGERWYIPYFKSGRRSFSLRERR
jgi:hypothetical protein